MKVYVDPACNINYCSFYIKGLRDLYGKENVKFTSKYFKTLRYTEDTHCLAFVIDGKKYVIDCADHNGWFFNKFTHWADVYGKVNFNPTTVPPEIKDKVVPVSPNFGIGVFGSNKWEATLQCLLNYAKCGKRVTQGFKSFLSPYLWLYKRHGLSLEADPSTVGSRKIFMVSRYWKGQDWTNDARINFIRACRRLEREGLIRFFGGLVPDTSDHNCPSDVLLEKEIPFDEYMKQMSESLIVFNTPAYHHCHGWKLPEYLAHGKIILSTPFENELPVPMTHGDNIYFTRMDEESIYKAVREIVGNKDLQHTLESGSRKYWYNYASPAQCMKSLINGSIN